MKLAQRNSFFSPLSQHERCLSVGMSVLQVQSIESAIPLAGGKYSQAPLWLHSFEVGQITGITG